MSGTRTVKFQWQIDLVDKASKQLLANDRAVRRSIDQTGKEWDKQARTAERAGGATLAMSRRVGQAARQQGRAAAMAGHDIDGLAASQRAQIRASEHAVTASRTSERQYRREAAAVDSLTRAQQRHIQTAKRAASSVGAASSGAVGAVGGAVAGAAATAGRAGLIGGTIATAAAIRSGWQYNKVIDAQNVGFVTLLGNYAKAAKFQAQIQALAIKSPVLDVESTGNAARSLMAYGVALKDVLPLTKAVGDMAAASGKEIGEVMPRAAMAIGQIASKGKLQAEEMNQLAESVGLSRGRIRQALGMGRKEFEESFKPGNSISADRALPAILKAMQTQSAGAADMLAQTTAGRLQRGKEVLARGFGLMTRPLYDGIGSLAGKLATKAQGVDFEKVGITIAAKLRKGLDTGRDVFGGLLGGIRGTGAPNHRQAATGTVRDAGGLGGERAAGTADPTKVATTAERIGKKIREIADGARELGTKLVEGLKPAEPFFKNILMPLVGGFAKGVIGSLVTAFQILGPVLGAVGKAAAPLKPVFGGIGLVLGFILAGPVLKLLGALPKVGIVFKVLGGVVGGVGRGFLVAGKLVGGFALKVLGFVAKINPAVIGIRAVLFKIPSAIAGVIGKVASGAKRLAGAITGAVEKVPGKVWGFIQEIPRQIKNGLGNILGVFTDLGAQMVSSMWKGIKSAASKLFGDRGTPDPNGDGAGGGGGGSWRRGGIIRRFQGGGLVDAMLSPGEDAYMPNGSVWRVPGNPVAADTVHARLPVGTAVITGHGQQLLDMGASMSQALAHQLPHFAGGGVVGAKTIARLARSASGGKLKGRRLAESVAISLGESSGNTHAENRNDNGTIDRGLWQINSIHGALSSFDPNTNAKGMWKISGHGKSWRPWVVFNTGAYRKHMAAATAAAGGAGTDDLADTSGTGYEKIMLAASRRRAGLLSDAVRQGIDAGRSGLTRRMYAAAVRGRRGATSNPLVSAIRQAQTATRRQISIPTVDAGDSTGGDGGGGGGSTTPVRGGFSAALRAAMTGAKRQGLAITSTTGGKHAAGSWHYKNRAFDAAGSPAGRMMAYAKWAAGTYGSRLKELFYDPLGYYYKNGKRVAGAIGGHGDHVHTALRRGGVVQRFRNGGTVQRFGKGGTALKIPTTGSLDAVDAIVGDAANTALERLRSTLIKQVRAGGDKQTVQRLQSVVSLIDGELGRRIGAIYRKIDLRAIRGDRRAGQYDRGGRKAGIDPTSVGGIFRQLTAGTFDVADRRADIANARQALKRANKTGDRDAIAEARETLTAAIDGLDEQITLQIERRRDMIRQAAQDVADSAQFGVDWSNGGLNLLDALQRQAGTSGTPAGLIQRSVAIRDSLIPALTGNRQAAIGQRDTALKLGDVAGVRTATLAIQQASTDIANAMADAADLVKQAALDAAQQTVDVAQHGTQLQQLQLTRIELEQRLAGVYEGGGQTRADFINTNLLPALQSELSALVTQQAQAQELGDQQLARQIAEAIAGKQNDLLQAQLDAMEQVAENTDTRAVGGGSLAFAGAGGTWTDQIINAGTGA